MGNVVQFSPAPPPKRVPTSPPMFRIDSVWVPSELLHKGLSDLALKQALVEMGAATYTDAEILLQAIISATAPERGVPT